MRIDRAFASVAAVAAELGALKSSANARIAAAAGGCRDLNPSFLAASARALQPLE